VKAVLLTTDTASGLTDRQTRPWLPLPSIGRVSAACGATLGTGSSDSSRLTSASLHNPSQQVEH
jgi:hypothetical protein